MVTALESDPSKAYDHDHHQVLDDHDGLNDPHERDHFRASKALKSSTPKAGVMNPPPEPPLDLESRVEELSEEQPAKSWRSQVLEHLAVLFFLAVFLLFGPFALLVLFALPLYTGNWYFTAAYMTFWLWDLSVSSKGGRGLRLTKWMRGWAIWTHYNNYFPIKLVKTVDIPPTKNYLFCSHPHGILCLGSFGVFATEGAGVSSIFPGLRPRLIGLEGNFWMPLFRELFLGSDACGSSKRSLTNLLSSPTKGMAPVLMVGGIPEIANGQKDKIVLVIRKRKGFVKLALQHGADLVPCFTFGEVDLFGQFYHVNTYVRDKLRKYMGFAPVFFNGKGFLQDRIGLLPARQPMHLVVGKPIKVDKVSDPTLEDIESLHEEYVATVVALYKENREKYGDPSKELVIA